MKSCRSIFYGFLNYVVVKLLMTNKSHIVKLARLIGVYRVLYFYSHMLKFCPCLFLRHSTQEELNC